MSQFITQYGSILNIMYIWFSYICLWWQRISHSHEYLFCKIIDKALNLHSINLINSQMPDSCIGTRFQSVHHGKSARAQVFFRIIFEPLFGQKVQISCYNQLHRLDIFPQIRLPAYPIPFQSVLLSCLVMASMSWLFQLAFHWLYIHRIRECGNCHHVFESLPLFYAFFLKY